MPTREEIKAAWARGIARQNTLFGRCLRVIVFTILLLAGLALLWRQAIN